MIPYRERLSESFGRAGTLLCVGIDPLPELLPDDLAPRGISAIIAIVEAAIEALRRRALAPAAFKPNIGYFQAADRPREGAFDGSRALATVLDRLADAFPDVPVILDSKRADIARSSANYAAEAFDAWGVDALTVAPYMGSDSVVPFLEHADMNGGGVYVLARTSNPGGKELQNLALEQTGAPLYRHVAGLIRCWSSDYPSCGAVVGATALEELEELLREFHAAPVPLLVPGVGRQGGSADRTMATLSRVGYPPELVRINASSGALFPWAASSGAASSDWRTAIDDALPRLHAALAFG